IFGRVKDENEQPVEGIRVSARRWMVENGRRVLREVSSEVSDDRGEFRLFDLLPGTYFLAFLPFGGGRKAAGFGQVFYAGTDAVSAQAISVKAGARVQIDQKLSHQRLYKVSGIVNGGADAVGFNVGLLNGAGEEFNGGASVDRRTGKFEITG